MKKEKIEFSRMDVAGYVLINSHDTPNNSIWGYR